MTVVLSFLKIFSLRKTIAYFFNISENLQKNQGKSHISGISWAFKIKLQILDVATYIAMFLPDSNNCFLICLIRYVYICFHYFLIFCSCFRLAKPAIHYFIHPPHSSILLGLLCVRERKCVQQKGATTRP